MMVSAPLVVIPYAVCSLAYAALVVLILAQAQRSRTGLQLAAASAVTAAWAATTAVTGDPWQGPATALDLLRIVAWYGFCRHLLYRSLGGNAAGTLFTVIGLAGLVATLAISLLGEAGLGGPVSMLSPGLLLRLAFAISQLLLLENLCRSTSAGQRWHVGLACIALGGFAAYDLLVCADAVLLRTASPTLVAGRAFIAVLVTPLLAMAAARNRNWQIDIHVSRGAVFHSATLVVSGVFLLALAFVGEAVRQLGAPFGDGWGSLAEICLVFAGLLTVMVLLTSGSFRGAVRRGFIDHFFTHRYDYRREWQRCIDNLSAAGSDPLSKRVISALAHAVDSPAGLLFTCEPGQAGLAWAGAWNISPANLPPLTSEITAALLAAKSPLVMETILDSEAAVKQFGRSFDPWLAVPLRQSTATPPEVLGCILLARPRTKFRLDAEVFDLLHIIAHEVSVHLAQERAASTLLETGNLRAYGERFAFVAHDIKNVSSQLSLLLSNAQTHLADPEFQRDMVATVSASVTRIRGLIRRLEPGQATIPAGTAIAQRLDTAAQLNALVAARRRFGGASVALAIDIAPGPAQPPAIRMEAAAFEAAVIHLIDNGTTAAGKNGTVRLKLYRLGARVVIDIADDGPGMTAEFIRDTLFTPFATGTEDGSGLGAFQARELVRAAGGDLTVESKLGHGTTMRLSWPVASAHSLVTGRSPDPAAQNAA